MLTRKIKNQGNQSLILLPFLIPTHLSVVLWYVLVSLHAVSHYDFLKLKNLGMQAPKPFMAHTNVDYGQT